MSVKNRRKTLRALKNCLHLPQQSEFCETAQEKGCACLVVRILSDPLDLDYPRDKYSDIQPKWHPLRVLLLLHIAI